MDLQKDIPAWVSFEMLGKEDREATIKNGHYTEKNVEMVMITPPYSKDCVIKEVVDWLRELDEHARNGRMPQGWADAYKAKYKAWKDGQELPEDGVPIKGWPLIGPAQAQNLMQMGVRTVEALAKMNDEGMKRYGMGALDLKNRAAAWLKAAKDTGPIVQENAALKAKMTTLEAQMKQVMESNEELKRLVQSQKIAA